MSEAFLLYAFVAVMTLNLLATVVYLAGMNQMKLALRRAFRSPQKPR